MIPASPIGRSIGLAILVTVIMLAEQVIAQPDGAQDIVEPVLVVLPITHSRAESIADALRQLQLAATIAVDERTNAMIVQAAPDVIATVNLLTSKLDVKVGDAGDGAAEMVVKVYPLSYITANEELAKKLEGLFGRVQPGRARGSSIHVRIAYDAGTNQLIAQGPPDLVAMLDDVIAALDRRPDTEGGLTELSIRLIWLVGGVDGDHRPPPDDVLEVVDELKRLGITDLSLASQTMIRITSGESFVTEFIADLPTPWIMRLQGGVETGDRGARRVTIELRGEPTDQSGPGTRIETTITTVSGHFVVLGATPIQSMDSVFVIQLIDVE